MSTAGDLAARFALPASPPGGEWRSSTMRMLDAVVTPGTAANLAASVAVTTLVLPRIPNRFIAAVAGFAACAVLQRGSCPAPGRGTATRSR